MAEGEVGNLGGEEELEHLGRCEQMDGEMDIDGHCVVTTM